MVPETYLPPAKVQRTDQIGTSASLATAVAEGGYGIGRGARGGSSARGRVQNGGVGRGQGNRVRVGRGNSFRGRGAGCNNTPMGFDCPTSTTLVPVSLCL